MSKVNQGLDKIKDLIKSETPLTAKQQIDGIHDIIYGIGMTRDEIEELADKTNELKQKLSGVERFNVGGLIAHILTYEGIDDGGEEEKIDPKKFPEPKKPVDPEKDPEGAYGDDTQPDFTDKRFKKKGNINTRGQKIKEDAFDYKKEYPGKGEITPERETAANIINHNKGLKAEDKEIIEKMIQQGAKHKDIVEHLKTRIQEERREMAEKREQRAFDHCVKEVYTGIKEYLEKEYGKEISEKLNELPDPSRIHLVGEYDFLDITGSENACGIFRTKKGDLYVSAEFLRKYEKAEPIGEITKPNGVVSVFPRIYREIKHIVAHEVLHSTSILNYQEMYGGKDVDTRRIGLSHANHRLGTYRGFGINEGTTENLAQKVLEYIYKEKEGLITYQPCWISYEEEQEIIKAIQKEIPELNRKDFHKAMILRKYGGEENIEGPTPLVELMRKINKGKEINRSKNPYFFQIMMDLVDYITSQKSKKKSERNPGDMALVMDFIKTKDITLLQNYFRNNLDIVFSKLILNKTKTNFNETILNAYTAEK